MRSHRNFKTNRCYHLLSRIANRAFYVDDNEKTIIAFDMMKMLSSTDAMIQVELRVEVGSTYANFFTSRYLTPLAQSGFIRLSKDINRFSRTKTYELATRGREVLSRHLHHSIPTIVDSPS